VSEPSKTEVGYGKTTSAGFDDAVAKVEQTLADEGFGVLCRIDVSATLKSKLDVDMPRYLILGSCNPKMAHRALSADPGVGLMLPCNVVVREVDDGTRIEAINPQLFEQIFSAPEIERVGTEVGEMLRRAVDRAVE
jgi:uncharacterized protein (DUF302 family)